ncbi:hypothetical protein F5Y19DRAFT_486270 [Xylariaceae sp. FL1651]|nr:hypothetical protein F5Y19DRAFT_486270 [Xylariaceae sp. FL1651]
MSSNGVSNGDADLASLRERISTLESIMLGSPERMIDEATRIKMEEYRQKYELLPREEFGIFVEALVRWMYNERQTLNHDFMVELVVCSMAIPTLQGEDPPFEYWPVVQVSTTRLFVDEAKERGLRTSLSALMTELRESGHTTPRKLAFTWRNRTIITDYLDILWTDTAQEGASGTFDLVECLEVYENGMIKLGTFSCPAVAIFEETDRLQSLVRQYQATRLRQIW